MGSNSVSSIGCAFMETGLVSEAVEPLPFELEFRATVSSTGGEVDDDGMPFLAEDGGGEG